MFQSFCFLFLIIDLLKKITEYLELHQILYLSLNVQQCRSSEEIDTK